jgi:hypothetical protein
VVKQKKARKKASRKNHTSSQVKLRASNTKKVGRRRSVQGSFRSKPYVPQDELVGKTPNLDLAADVMELSAFYAKTGVTLLSGLTNTLDIGQDEYTNVNSAVVTREGLLNGVVAVLESRSRELGSAYPFELDGTGSSLKFLEVGSWGKILYVISLILSHLPASTAVLEQAGLTPSAQEIVSLRRWFQYCSTASTAAEVGGHAWAFGWPRPDQSGFLDKLREIWEVLNDGEVRSSPPAGSPKSPKDDEVDIIAARRRTDGLVGFPILLAQVASGENWKAKSLRTAAEKMFFPEWFSMTPASQVLVYQVIPFTAERTTDRRDTRMLGHIMHRLRVCSRAEEARRMIEIDQSLKIEGSDAFVQASDWMSKYRSAFAL